jgi:hypothetical protein
MMLRRAGSFLVLVVLGLTLLTACGGSERSRSQEGGAIVLDRSIGGVALGKKRSDVEWSLGKGFVLDAEDQKPPEPPVHGEQVLYAKSGLEVWYVSTNASKASRARARVIAVVTRSPRYQTPQGVHVGSPAAALDSIQDLKCYLEDCQHGYHALNQPGTTFRLDHPRGEVTMIAIAYGH